MSKKSRRWESTHATRKPNTFDRPRPAFEGLEPRVLFSSINVTVSTQLGLITNNSAPTIAGIVDDPAAAVSVTIAQHNGAGHVTLPAITDGAGNWSLTLPAGNALADGHYDVTVDATDNGGADTGEVILSDDLIIDTIHPTLTFNNGQLPAFVNADTMLTGTYADANISTIALTVDDGQGSAFHFSATLDTNAQSWAASIPIAGLNDAAYSITATATDLAGNVTALPSSAPLTVDNTAPTVDFDNHALPALIDADGTLTGNYTDANIYTIVVTLNDGHGVITPFTANIDANSHHWSAPIPIAGLSNGSYTVSVTATDRAGNTTTTTGAGALTVDTAAFDAGQLPAFINANTTLTGSYTDANISSIMVTVDNGHGGTTGFSATLDTSAHTFSVTILAGGLSDGSYAVSITTTSMGGGGIAVMGAGTITVDTTAPGVTLDTGVLPAFVDIADTLTGTYTDTNISTITVALDDGHGGVTHYPAVIDTGAHTWSAAISVAGLANGSYNVSVAATDLASNSTTVNGTGLLTVDKIAPGLTIDNELPIFTHTDTTLTGTYTDDNISSIVATFADDHGGMLPIHATIDTHAHRWSVAIPLASFPEGAYRLAVTAMDLASNTRTDNVSDDDPSLIVDTTLPVVTLDDGELPVHTHTNTTLSGGYDDATFDSGDGDEGDGDAAPGDIRFGTIVVTLDNGAGGVFHFNATLTPDPDRWSAPVALNGLPNGTYAVSILGTDLAGNTSTIHPAGSFTIDAAPPVVAINSGLFPVKVNADKTLAGTFTDANINTITVTVSDGNGHTGSFRATINTTAGTWNAVVALASLPDGVYSVSVTATDHAGGSTTANAAGALTIHAAAPIVALTTTSASNARPALGGTIDDPSDTVVVTIGGTNYTAVTQSDGTWALAANTVAALPDGENSVMVTATDTLGHATVLSDQMLLVDTTAPIATANSLITAAASPALSGTVDDRSATIVVNVNGANYDAVNHHDGTWSLAAGSITALGSGVYDVKVTATDSLGNTGTNTLSRGLVITNSQSVTLGSSITKITYKYLGTTVTMSAGAGSIRVILSGVNVRVMGTGKSRTISGVGGVLQVDIVVLAKSKSLNIATAGGLAAINRITGAAALDSLTGDGIDLLGGIQMAGAIQTIKLHSIQSDITMGSTSSGASITADLFENSDIRVAHIKALNATRSFQNTNVIATTIAAASLANVATNNGGNAFGLTADKLASLRLKQGAKTLTFGKQFSKGVGDFFVRLV